LPAVFQRGNHSQTNRNQLEIFFFYYKKMHSQAPFSSKTMALSYFFLIKQYVISLMSEKFMLQRNDFFVKS
jgi:hypothetical protein